MDKAKAEEQVIIFLLKGEKFGLNIKNLISISEPERIKGRKRGRGIQGQAVSQIKGGACCKPEYAPAAR